LNVAVTTSDVNPTVGTDTYVGQLDMSTVTAGWYCDDGAGGVGGFRLDSPAAATAPCASPSRGGWSVNTDNYGAPYYLPAVQFNTGGTGDLYPGTSQPINFSVTNPGGGDEYINSVTITASSVSNQTIGGLCDLTWFPITGPTAPVGVDLVPGTTYYYGDASVKMVESSGDQDPCQGVTVNLKFAST
jgi:hypothetical protein